jgi:two-component system, sensor histidine kinase and response regulator
VESQQGRGSCFHFTCRVGVVSAGTAPEPVALGSLHGLSALIVDDNSTNRRILARLLESIGMRSTMAGSGAEALKTLERAAAEEKPFSLMVLDCRMPEMDGFNLIERIRARQNPAAGAIIMLTSAGQPGDLRRCRELGISVHLTKPVHLSHLIEAIQNALTTSAAPRSAPDLTTRQSRRGEEARLKVLLAEDNAVNQKVAMRLLEQDGHTVTVVNTGRAALLALEQREFDMVFMDVQMPEMDGFEATAAIRENEKDTGRHVPIIAMTAHAMSGDRERCIAAGMDGYTSKPIRQRELVEEIDRVRAAIIDGRYNPPEARTTVKDSLNGKLLERVAGIPGFAAANRQES